jgi:hypothetical protein
MALDKYKLGWSTGGKIVLGTNPYYAGKYTDGSPYSETDGVSDLLTIDALMTAGEVSRSRTPVVEAMASIGAIDDQESRVKVLIADGVQIVNGDYDLPGYFRIGNWDFQLSVQMLTELKDYDRIQIGVTDTLNPIILSAQEYINMNATVSFGGIEAMGGYAVNLELVGIPDSYTDSASTSEPFSLTFS